MKLLVFAHTPPPHHGQSYMTQLMLTGFGGDHRTGRHRPVPRNTAGDVHGIECYHVNVRLSRTLEDIGEFHGTKLFLLLLYCLQAIWCRFRYGVTSFYYIPAPGKRSALYRDWLVMFLCRPFFKRIIFHWHAAGLAKWLETAVQIRTRAVTFSFLRQAALSIVLSNYNRPDAENSSPGTFGRSAMAFRIRARILRKPSCPVAARVLRHANVCWLESHSRRATPNARAGTRRFFGYSSLHIARGRKGCSMPSKASAWPMPASRPRTHRSGCNSPLRASS